jgi:hypothetical protein
LFIIVIISLNVILYLLAHFLFHRVAFRVQQMKMKRTLSYISLFETRCERTYSLIDELYKTIQYIKNFSVISHLLQEKRLAINLLALEVFFLQLTKSFEDYMFGLYYAEREFKINLKRRIMSHLVKRITGI